MPAFSLSKSTYIRGLQCLKSLYLNKHRSFLRDRLSEEQLAKFARGHAIGKVARQLFPGGVEIPAPSEASARKTQKLIAEGYVVKTRDEKDKRAWNLFPTSAAKAVYEPIVAEENRNIAICFDGFTKAERDMLCRMVARMSGNIDKEWKKYKNYKI